VLTDLPPAPAACLLLLCLHFLTLDDFRPCLTHFINGSLAIARM
jgi:hypothetical protein